MKASDQHSHLQLFFILFFIVIVIIIFLIFSYFGKSILEFFLNNFWGDIEHGRTQNGKSVAN